MIEKFGEISKFSRQRAEFHNPDMLKVWDKINEIIDVLNKIPQIGEDKESERKE